MKLLKNSMMALTLALSSVAPYAHAETTQQATAKAYLQGQLAELQDLKEQLAVVNKKKSTAKVVLYVSAGAMAAGPVLFLMQIGGSIAGAAIEIATREKVTNGVIDKLILEHGSQIGLVLLGAGTVGAVSSGGYLIYLNKTQAKQLENEITQLEADIRTTAEQLK